VMPDVWTLPPEPFPLAHFAVFPTELPRRCILAGTSERGCCPHCGAPWERVVEREYVDNPGHKWGSRGSASVDPGTRTGPAFDDSRLPVTRTTGWQASCSCPEHEPIPCLVLDPFSGAGTTLLVARRLQRRALGIDLSPEYVEMARRRILNDNPLFNVPPPGEEEEVAPARAAAGRGAVPTLFDAVDEEG
jgi:SAM-dependent methyltransferase